MIYTENHRLSDMNPTENRGWTKVLKRRSIYQFNNLWFDPNGARTDSDYPFDIWSEERLKYRNTFMKQIIAKGIK